MTLAAVRTKIKDIIEDVTGIGTVYDYKRYVNQWDTYKDLFVKNDKINTWEIQRTDFSIDPHGGSGGVADEPHEFIIRGFYAVNDKLASEKTFQDLAQLVAQAFRDKPTLDGIANIVNFPITGSFSEGKLGDVLSHIVEIKLSVEERTLF